MSTKQEINELHSNAMDHAEMAVVAKLKGDDEKALSSFNKAFDLERKAADLLVTHFDQEPSRSVLYRSAASLALDCGETREAERLVAAALAGNPPAEIAEELRDLLEQVYFHRHLELRKIQLTPSELQFSIAGSAVGAGVAPTDAFISRIKDVERLIIRTAERKLGIAYRVRGEAKPQVKSRFELYLSVPRAASFAVTIQIGQQLELPLGDSEEGYINEMLDCIELLNLENMDELGKRIPQESYYRNFVALARNIAPDGKKVSQVGFTVQREGKSKCVSITKPREEIVITEETPIRRGKRGDEVKVRGVLLFADSLHKLDAIKLRDKRGREHKILVPEGMMDDIVKPLWHDQVIVRGRKTSKGIHLDDIMKSK